MPGPYPFQSRPRVAPRRGRAREAASALGVHPSELGRWEVIVRALDAVDPPGHTVNVFRSGAGSSYLPAAEPVAVSS